MKHGPSDAWLTHDAGAEQPDNICEKCGGFLAVAVDPEGCTVYCTECPPTKHQTKPQNGTDNNNTQH